MKRILIAVLLLPCLGLAYLWIAEDMAPGDLAAGLGLATGLGAKLACSSQYLSGFDQQTIEDDLATYSPLMRSVRYAALPGGGVEATLYGASAQARYRPGLGCTLEFGPSALQGVTAPAAPVVSAGLPWPLGSAQGQPDARVQALLQAMLQRDNAAGLQTRALLVVQDGAMVGEAYAPGIDRNTPLLGWSMGKTVTAIMVGRLQAMGLIQPDESALFAAWRNDERAAITLQNMLQMTSGLGFVEDYVPGSDATRMLFMSPTVVTVPLASALRHPPGTHFYYSSGSTNLLASLVFDRVGGTPQKMVDFFSREIATPLRLQGTYLEMDASGVPVGSSFVYAIARDWARFGQLLLDAGLVNGQRLLPEGWVAQAVQPNGSANDGRYGYQLWLNDGADELNWPSLPKTVYAMLGNREQVVMMVPSRRALVVRLGWSAGEYPVDTNVAEILAALAP
jgi:CubicO group peptidase (beta-lactamase class C family)